MADNRGTIQSSDASTCDTPRFFRVAHSTNCLTLSLAGSAQAPYCRAIAVDTVQRTAQVYSLPAEARPHQALWHINLVGATSDLNKQMPKCQQQQSLPICRLQCTPASKHLHCLLPSLRTPFPFPLSTPIGTKPPPTLFARRMSQ